MMYTFNRSPSLLSRLMAVGLLAGLLPASAVAGDRVIEVYLLGGQSNMAGVGRVDQVPADYLPESPCLLYHSNRTFSQDGANQWITIQPSGHTNGYFGPEIGFAKRMAELDPAAEIALIKHSVSATDLANHWDPGTLGQTGTYGSQYLTFVQTVNNGLSALQQENPDAEILIRGMFWQQGERDSTSNASSADYADNLNQLIQRVREEFQTPDMRFVYGQVHDTVGNEAPTYLYNDRILEAQGKIAQDSGDALAMPGAFLVESADFQVHGDLQDGFRDTDFAHFSDSAMLDLGERYADVFHQAYALRADLNADQQIAMADLNVVLTHFGQSVTSGDRASGDINFDRKIDGDDLAEVLRTWTGGEPPEVHVPEAGSLTLPIIGGLLIAARRR